MSATAIGIIFGGVITVLVSLFFYLLQKRSRYPGELRVAVTDFKRIVSKGQNKLDKLSLKYDDFEVSQNLVYYEMIITNSRTYDIKSDESSSPLSFSLPKGSKWIDVQVKYCSEGVTPVVLQNNENCIDVCWSLLRKKEYILLAGLIETSTIFSDDKLLADVSITHRIPNISPIKKITVVDKDNYRRLLYYCAFFISFASVLFFVQLFVPNRLSNIKYLDTETDKVISIYVDRNDNLVLYHNMFKLERVPYSDVGRRYIQVYKHSQNSSYTCWITLFFILIFAAIFVNIKIRFSRTNSIVSLIKTNDIL